MALKESHPRITPLQLAIERGTRPGGELRDELARLADYAVKSRSDAEVICGVLERRLRRESTLGGDESLHALIGLFQEVEGPDCPAFGAMVELGQPLLIEIAEVGSRADSQIDPEDVLFALKILAIYGTRAGTEAVIRAAADGFQADSYWWHLILEPYGDGHPESPRLFRALSNHPLDDFLAVSLIDSANVALNNGTELDHPFDTPNGRRQIEQWLTDPDPESATAAASAAVALAHIDEPFRDRMLAVALDHQSDLVRLEAALSAARVGIASGIDVLARLAQNVHHSAQACAYLRELGQDDAIPPIALDPGFEAMAELSQWLAHPCELGHAPERLEVISERTLYWPPESATKTLRLISFQAPARETAGTAKRGMGLVGSTTLCLFDLHMAERSPDDVLAIHCYWELDAKGLITEAEVEAGSTEYDGMLRRLPPGEVIAVNVVLVAEPAVDLKYPERLVGLATALRKHGEAGWFVLDGPRTRWYSAADMPGEGLDKAVLMIHVGRVLLGLGQSRPHPG